MGKKSGRSLSNRELTMKGSMRLKTIVQTNITEYSILRWFLKDYRRLDPNVLYFQMYEGKDLQCVFKLTKTLQYASIAVRLGYTNTDASFYLDNGTFASKLVQAAEISAGLYVAHFPQSLILHSQGYCMNKGILKIVFRFIVGSESNRQDRALGEIGVLSDVDCLCSDFKYFYLVSYRTDFTFNVGDMSLKAHKCVLFARSKFFEEYFQKHKDSSVFSLHDTTPGIMHEALLFMYSGELSKMSAECMVKVLELAYLFKIQSLKKRCSKFFEETRSWSVLRGIDFWEYVVE